MQQLIYLSPVPWTSFSQRPHMFVEWYHNRTGGSVLWFEPYPTRFPHFNDLQRLRSPVTGNQHNTPPAWLTVLKPGGLPVETIARFKMGEPAILATATAAGDSFCTAR